jgi:cytolysin (calcineurin-like family phosphatase)
MPLSKKQFPWTKHYEDSSGITWHTHTASGHKVYNTLTGRYRWQIVGGTHNGELHTSLGDAKKVVEASHEGQ